MAVAHPRTLEIFRALPAEFIEKGALHVVRYDDSQIAEIVNGNHLYDEGNRPVGGTNDELGELLAGRRDQMQADINGPAVQTAIDPGGTAGRSPARHVHAAGSLVPHSSVLLGNNHGQRLASRRCRLHPQPAAFDFECGEWRAARQAFCPRDPRDTAQTFRDECLRRQTTPVCAGLRIDTYALNHLPPDVAERVEFHAYAGRHMFYMTDESARKRFIADVLAFIDRQPDGGGEVGG